MVKKASALLMIVFLSAMFMMAMFTLVTAIHKTETPKFEGIWTGTWTPTFEKALNESLPIEASSRSIWGWMEYTLFGQGRKGVQIGQNGWLFTDEEFSCLPQADKNFEDNIAYVSKTFEKFRAMNIELVVVVIPAKTRVYPEYLGKNTVPSCRERLYDETVNAIASLGIRTQGLLPVMAASTEKDKLFLKTDTHWTPEGARLAAVAIAETMGEYQFPQKLYTTGIGEDQPHEGDLLRYVPGVAEDEIPRDNLKVYATQEAQTSEDAAADLFGDSIPPVTLVGTSYSANPKWNFPGFVREFLTTDVLNMADEGLGPFTVMDKYLSSDALKNSAPAVVLWEIPERYMTTKLELQKK